jgi:hypothetical protein
MYTRILLPGLVAIVLATPSLAEGVIYKWTDADGVTHYSDVPRDGAEEIQLQPVQTFSAPETPVSSADADEETVDEEDELAYESLAISSPIQEETIWNTGGKVSVSISLSPGLRMGHTVRMYYDGRLLGDLPPGTTTAELNDVVRGSHTLRAEVMDQSGRILIQSEEITFFYQQTAVNRRPGVR